MSEKSAGKNKVVILLLLAVAASALFTADSSGVIDARPGYGFFVSFLSYPQRAVVSSWRAVRDFCKGVFGLGRLADRGRELEMELNILREQVSELEGYRRENERLRELLDFRARPGFEEIFRGSIGAEVIGRNPLNWYRTVTVDRGRNDGVTTGMAVVGVGGLAGRVVVPGTSASVVMLILDSGSRVSALAESTGEHGIITGRGDGILVMKYLSDKSEIQIGDRVKTSGLGGIFPKGISIGSVSGVLEEDYGLTVSAEVSPAVDFSRLENVLILRN